MTDHDEDHEADGRAERTTAPQSSYSMRDVTIGAVVALFGVAVTFGVPFLLL